MHFGRKLVLTIIALITLLGPLVVSAQAAMVPTKAEIFQHDLVADPNGNTYLSFGPMDGFYGWNAHFLDQDEDLNYESYTYDRASWNDDSGSYLGPAHRMVNNLGYPSEPIYWGWLDTGHFLNSFTILENTTDEYEVRLDAKRYVFPITIGQEDSLFMESGYPYYGTFNVTDEEFFHLTVGSYQDNVGIYFAVMDPNGRFLGEWGLGDGDIEVCPFRTTGSGTYTIIFDHENIDYNGALINFLLESAEPMELALGDVAEGVLEGSEIFLGEDSSVVHREKAPHAVTYKVSTNSTQAGIVRSFFNLPEIMPLSTDMYEPRVFITSDSYRDFAIETAYMDMIFVEDFMSTAYTDAFHYKSFANETYYLTILGMDETSYVLTNNMADAPDLPLNEKFYIENHAANDKQFLYTLNLGQDSVLKVNSTEVSSGFSWSLWTVDGAKRVWDTSIGDSSAFSSATTYYIPAGSYLVLADAQSSSCEGWYDFNLGPVLDGAGAVSVDVGSIIGMRVDTDPMTFYRLNTTLTTQANVTIASDIDIFGHLGRHIRDTTATLGTRQDGVYWHAYGTNMTSWELGTDSQGYSMFSDNSAIVTIAPYQAQNNTIGHVSDWYNTYTCDFDMSFYEDGDTYINGTSQVTVASSPVWNNITLGDPSYGDERYVVEITCPADTWFNFSCYAEDVDSFAAYIYQYVDGLPQRVSWTYIDATMTGATDDESSFEFGSISTTMLLVFEVARLQVEEGRLDVLITPFVTNDYVYAPQVEYFGGGGSSVSAPASLVIDPLLAVGGIAIIAVVVVVFARKTGRI